NVVELVAISSDAFKAGFELRQGRHGHFVRVLDGPQRLLFETAGAAIPEEEILVGDIDDGRRLAVAGPRADAVSERLAVAPSFGRIMTRRAGNRAVSGEPFVEEQLLA